MPVPVIDTHIHIWNLEKARYAWLEGDNSLLNRSYEIEELATARQRAGIAGGVLVQAANNRDDTVLMLEAAAHADWIKGVVGWLPLTDPAATEKTLTESYLKNTYFKGCRHLIHNEADPDWLLQEPVLESLEILAGYKYSYDVVGINDRHLLAAIRVAEKIPGLKIVLDHLNQPPVSSRQRFGNWGTLMKEAASHANVFAKISGLGTTTGKGESWTPADIQPYVTHTLETFGTGRCFCGGDWPVSLLAGAYERTWSIYREVLEAALPEAEQHKVFWQNAQAFYQLETEPQVITKQAQQ